MSRKGYPEAENLISSLKRKEKEHAEEKKRKQELGVEDEFVTSDEMQRD